MQIRFGEKSIGGPEEYLPLHQQLLVLSIPDPRTSHRVAEALLAEHRRTEGVQAQTEARVSRLEGVATQQKKRDGRIIHLLKSIPRVLGARLGKTEERVAMVETLARETRDQLPPIQAALDESLAPAREDQAARQVFANLKLD